MHHRLQRTRLFHAEQAAQVDLGVNIMRDLALVEEAREVGFHFSPTGDPHTKGEEATQVFLHKRQVVSIQTLLPGLLGPLTFLFAQENILHDLTTNLTCLDMKIVAVASLDASCSFPSARSTNDSALPVHRSVWLTAERRLWSGSARWSMDVRLAFRMMAFGS